MLAAAIVAGLGTLARAADDKDAKALLDKGIKALGGEEKLSTLKAATWKSKGTISFGGNDNPFTSATIVQGLDHLRNEFEGEFGGNKVMGITVVAGDKGWRKFGDMKMELDKDGLANEKRSIYLSVIPMTLLPLKDKAFKIEAAGEDKVGGKPALGIKVTPADGKVFTLYFDEENGLPVKQVAKVIGFMGQEYTQETTFADYKDFQGIKKATRIENKRDMEKFLEQQITEFKALDKVDPKTFAEPK
jgi:hypothetical protein